MSQLVKRQWRDDPALPASPVRSAPFTYEAFVPDEISTVDPVLPASVARVIAEADQAVRELNHEVPGVTGLEALSHQLLRQESVASSRIEGLVMSHRRLAKAAVAEEDQHRDAGAESILANIDAMDQAIEVTSVRARIEVADLLDVHRVLMEKTRDAHLAGVVRTSQNWIGGNNYNPSGAAFIPPPEGEVDRLLEDLAEFMNRSDLSPTLQAALAHAQFETIHPFADGNGRTGRCFVHVVFRRAEIAPRFVPPISLVLETDSDAYVRGLTAYREDRFEDWYLDFALTVIKACRAARNLSAQLDELEAKWIGQAGTPREGSAARRIIQGLPGQPVFRATDAIESTGASKSAVHDAIKSLESAGVVKQVTVGKRNRAWEAVGLLRLLDEFERRVATPDAREKLARPAPYLN